MSWRLRCMVAGYFALPHFAANLPGAEPDRSASQTAVSSAAEEFARAFTAGGGMPSEISYSDPLTLIFKPVGGGTTLTFKK